MTVFLSPVGGAGAQFFSNNGVPLTGGKLYTYAAGTTTPQTTYTSSAGDTAHTNPVILDSAGRVSNGGEIWLTNALLYKFVLKDATDVLIATWDNISGIGPTNPTVVNFTGDGSQTVFSIGGAPASEDTTDVYINGVYQQKNTYSINGGTLIFSEAPPLTSTIELNYI